MKTSIIIAILLCIALYNIIGLVNKIEHTTPEYKYEVTDELQDIWVSLTWAIKYEVLLHKEIKKVFDSKKMKYVDKIVYYHSDSMYPKYRITFSSWSVWNYYLQPYIQWWYELLPDNDVK